MSEKQKELRELINQRVTLTLYPELQYNFDSEPDRTKYLQSLDEKLAAHGVDGYKLQEEAVARHYGIQAPIHTLVIVEFPKEAS